MNHPRWACRLTHRVAAISFNPREGANHDRWSRQSCHCPSGKKEKGNCNKLQLPSSISSILCKDICQSQATFRWGTRPIKRPELKPKFQNNPDKSAIRPFYLCEVRGCIRRSRRFPCYHFGTQEPDYLDTLRFNSDYLPNGSLSCSLRHPFGQFL